MLLSMTPNERLLGWVNVGRPAHPQSSLEERAAIDIKTVATVLDGEAIVPFES